MCEISDIGSEHNIDYKNLYFQYKLNTYKTCFKISLQEGGNGGNNPNKSKQVSGDSFMANKIK